MNRLIVHDTDGHEVLTRPLASSEERYTFCAMQMAGEPFVFAGRRYKMHSVAWRKQEQDCVLCVSFHSWDASYCDD